MGDFKMVDGELVPLSDAEQAEHDNREKEWPGIEGAQRQVAAAREAMAESDMVAIRCFKAKVPFPKEWSLYVQELRAILSSGGGALPTKPEYPEGS